MGVEVGVEGVAQVDPAEVDADGEHGVTPVRFTTRASESQTVLPIARAEEPGISPTSMSSTRKNSGALRAKSESCPARSNGRTSTTVSPSAKPSVARVAHSATPSHSPEASVGRSRCRSASHTAARPKGNAPMKLMKLMKLMKPK